MQRATRRTTPCTTRRTTRVYTAPQNVANLLWGFASLRYQPAQLLPPLSAALASSGLCLSAKPVEVADLAFALSRYATQGLEPQSSRQPPPHRHTVCPA